jgi:hypothetical protein
VLINQDGRRDIDRHIVSWEQPSCKEGLNGSKAHVVGLVALRDESNPELSHASSTIVKEYGAVSAILVDSHVGLIDIISHHMTSTVAQQRAAIGPTSMQKAAACNSQMR